jgi:hypothetical protein
MPAYKLQSLALQKALAKLGQIGIGDFQGMAQVIVEGAVGFGDGVEGGFEGFGSGSHDDLHGGGVGRLRKAENLLEIAGGAFDGVWREHVFGGEQIVLNDDVARNTDRGQKNCGERAGAVLARSVVLKERQIAGGNALANLAVLRGATHGVLVPANIVLGLGVDGIDAIGTRADKHFYRSGGRGGLIGDAVDARADRFARGVLDAGGTGDAGGQQNEGSEGRQQKRLGKYADAQLHSSMENTIPVQHRNSRGRC